MNVSTSLETPTPTNDECILSDDEAAREYNLTLHIISIFVLLIVSLVGAAISVISTRVKRLGINPIIINTGKYFGSGVVLSTGFIHMLSAGMKLLTDECLPDSWNVYGAYAGLFAMLAALIMQFIEVVANGRYRLNQRSKPNPTPNDQNDEFKRDDQTEIKIQEDQAIRSPADNSSSTNYNHHQHHHHGVILQDNDQNNKISAYLLEFGIALHSIIIGLTLGTTTESFVTLFIAISFHQFFEAIALGAQIARSGQISIPSVTFMVVFFALTTPIGIGIGIGIHLRTYNPKSVASLLINGILDSVSGGILIYIGLVNLLAAEMGAGAHEFHSLSKKLKLLYFAALYTGVGVMAAIGRWA